jgi:PAS domain S-box-containing protein
MRNINKRKAELETFVLKYIQSKNGSKLIPEYEHIISTITAFETMEVFDFVLESGVPLETVKANTGKLLNLFHKSLRDSSWDKPGEGHFLHYLMLENRETEKIIAEVKTLNKELFKGETDNRPELTSRLRELMTRLRGYEVHYIKKENILFPQIEKVFPQYHCLQVMWSFHDDFRKILKMINLNLADKYPDYDLLNKQIGKLFFIVLPVIFREEQIVFPVAYKMLPNSCWEEMLDHSYEHGWCYIDPPQRKTLKTDLPVNGFVNLGSGLLTAEQIKLIFNNLPVDITFIDEEDSVKYFSESKERIFPRSRSIIGRKVQNCHPPESVHVVNEIIAAFRKGEKDHADFWIHLKKRFLYIRYFAIRNETGKYCGTLEVSQDITEARELSNERRLLNWNS